MRSAPGRGEITLVVFTVLAPASVGLVLADAALRAVGGAREPVALPVALALLAAGIASASFHPGRPRAARRALANLASSWLSRELLLGAVFGIALAALVVRRETPAAEEVAVAVLGLLFVGAISRVYRIRTVPAWDGVATPAAFFGTALVLGTAPMPPLAGAAAAFALLNPAVSAFHLRRLAARGGAAAESAAAVRDGHRALLVFRVATALVGAALLLAGSPFAAASACVLLFASELAARTLFYASRRRVGL
jgi:DMSO reductase anchor subunit